MPTQVAWHWHWPAALSLVYPEGIKQVPQIHPRGLSHQVQHLPLSATGCVTLLFISVFSITSPPEQLMEGGPR